MTNNPPTAPFDALIGQDMVARFLTAVIQSNKPGHAYLFCGPLGSGKTEAARVFAQALLCEQRGLCQQNSGEDCDSCMRVAHGTHPDYRVVAPAGVRGYVIEQIQELIASTGMAPLRAHRKVYLLTRADLLTSHTANALLKTLEEPPDDTVIILLARNRDAVIQTIASRCQVLPFRRIPEPEALATLVEKVGASPQEARIALATTGGSLYYAEEFLRSTTRRNLRIATLETLERLTHADDARVLESAKGILAQLKAPLEDYKDQQQQQLEQSRDFLSAGSLSRLEQQLRREFTSRERETIGEVLEVSRSWVRDIMVMHMPPNDQQPVNGDFLTTLKRLAQQVELPSCVRALDAIDEAERQIQYNVSLQLALEVMLFSLRTELAGV